MKRLAIVPFILAPLLVPLVAFAEPSAFEQALKQTESRIETQESVEIHDGIRYRKVESKLGVFWFKFLSRNEDISELECGPKFNRSAPSLITASAQVFRRTSVFIRGLKEMCESNYGQKRTRFTWSPEALEVGIQIPDSENSVLHQKSITTMPLAPGPNLGFSSNF